MSPSRQESYEGLHDNQPCLSYTTVGANRGGRCTGPVGHRPGEDMQRGLRRSLCARVGTRRLGRVNPSVSAWGISGVSVMQSIIPSIGVQLVHRPPRGWFAYLPGKA
jgi:hypothetical protein